MKRNWTKEQIQQEIEEMDGYIPVSKIEETLGMPPTTLQKVLSGKRKLPKKWIKVLEAYFVRKPGNNKLMNSAKSNIEFSEKTPKAYDSREVSFIKMDEVGTWQAPNRPTTLAELKILCPKELTGFDRSTWIAQKRQEYGI